MSKLSDRLNARRAELDVSTRAIADTATAAGFDMSHTTVARYLRPHHPRPTPETVEALAAGFKLSASELLRLAGLQAAGGAYVPPASSRLLTTAQRNAVSEIIRLLAEGNGADLHLMRAQENAARPGSIPGGRRFALPTCHSAATHTPMPAMTTSAPVRRTRLSPVHAAWFMLHETARPRPMWLYRSAHRPAGPFLSGKLGRHAESEGRKAHQR